jgi:hypothetical protein
MHKCFDASGVTEMMQPGMLQSPSNEFRRIVSCFICLGTTTDCDINHVDELKGFWEG